MSASIVELLAQADQLASDLEVACDQAEAWIENHRSRQRAELVDRLDQFERSIRSEVFSLGAFIEGLETSETRGRAVAS